MHVKPDYLVNFVETDHTVTEISQLFNNNNNSHDNVYGAVIMTKVIARVHPVHLMNVD